MQDHISETVTVTVGMLGTADTALGAASLDIELTGDAAERAQQVGQAISVAYMNAMEDAAREFYPKMVEHFRDQRLRADDPSVE